MKEQPEMAKVIAIEAGAREVPVSTVVKKMLAYVEQIPGQTLTPGEQESLRQIVEEHVDAWQLRTKNRRFGTHVPDGLIREIGRYLSVLGNKDGRLDRQVSESVTPSQKSTIANLLGNHMQMVKDDFRIERT